MKFDLSIIAAATALAGSVSAAPQNSNNGNNWQSYASQASSYWQSAAPTATGEWSSWANAASSYWNSVSPSAAPSQWSSYASAASSYWASNSGSQITAAPSAFPWAGGYGPGGHGGPGGWKGGNGYGPFGGNGSGSNATNSGWGPWGQSGAWTSGPWTSWWGGSNCPDSTWSGWTSGLWGTSAPWTSWSGCQASTTATSTVTTTVSGTPTTSLAYGVQVAAASQVSGSGSGTAATASASGAAAHVGVSGAGVAKRVESVFGWQKVVWRDACFGKLSISTLSSSLSHESTPSKSTVRYLRSSHEAVAASEEAKRVEDPLVVASTDRARRKGNLPPSCFFIPHSILFIDHNTDLLALAISITSGLCSTNDSPDREVRSFLRLSPPSFIVPAVARPAFVVTALHPSNVGDAHHHPSSTLTVITVHQCPS
ncbi:hypothetical protein D6C81_07937 [Aureobasidium pullulans]|nr:hypothetical protein D6C81_07937 [Aureobasidium pullulans]